MTIANSNSALKRSFLSILGRFGLPVAVALAAFFFLQTNTGKASFLATPDRSMLDLSYVWRMNRVTSPAPPVTYFRIDDYTLAGYWADRGSQLFPQGAGGAADVDITQLPTVTPRGLLAIMLNTLRDAASSAAVPPRAVMLDVDIGWSAHDPGDEALLAQALSDWSQDRNAPLLVVARETLPFTARRLSGVNEDEPERQLPPAPPYDDIVAASPNIIYASVGVRRDAMGVVRDYTSSECAIGPEGAVILPHTVTALTIADGANSGAAAKTAIQRTVSSLATECVNGRNGDLSRPVPIAYHLAIGPQFAAPIRTVPPVVVQPATWRHGDECGAGRLSGDWWPVDEFLTAAQAGDAAGVSELVCGSIVFIGGSTSLQADMSATPYGRMDGAVILANAVRGQLMSAHREHPAFPILKLAFQVVAVVLTVALVLAVFFWFRRLRGWIGMARQSSNQAVVRGLYSAALLLISPMALNWIAPIFVFILGAVVTIGTLTFGVWGVVSVPAFAAALTEALIEWKSEIEQ